MTKIWSPVAIDYSAGVSKGKDGELIPNKVGACVEDLDTAKEFARRWKA